MCKTYKKYLIVLTCIAGLAFSPATYADSSVLTKLTKSSKLSIKTAKSIGRVRTFNRVSTAFKPVKVSTFKSTALKPKVFKPITNKPALVAKNASQFRMNQQRLTIQSNVKKNVGLAKKNLGIKSPATFRGKFGENANPGLIYKRQMGKNVYIGQTKNLKRYPKRQLEHSRKLKKELGNGYSKASYQIVTGAPGNSAKLLRIAEETTYRTQKQFASQLTNKINPMANHTYLSAIGR